jgi:hypothetical protein
VLGDNGIGLPRVSGLHGRSHFVDHFFQSTIRTQHRIDRGKGRMHRLHFFKDYPELLRDNRR